MSTRSQSHAPRPITVLRRGEVDQPGEAVGPGALTCVRSLSPTFTLPQSDVEGNRRAALADWLASPANVLTWRSIANRLWHYHFGRGIVETPNDFGRNGALPTHPELLDWLAVSVRDRGQSLKVLHRLIVCSAVYRQESFDTPSLAAIDADNHFLWRQNRRRLDAEAVRDSVLATAGTLDVRMGGPGFEPFFFKDDHSPIYDHSDPAKIDGPAVRRRSVYRFIVRSVPNPFMEALDCADPNLNTPVRSQTLTALPGACPLERPVRAASVARTCSPGRTTVSRSERGGRVRLSTRIGPRAQSIRARRAFGLHNQARFGPGLPAFVQHQRICIPRLNRDPPMRRSFTVPNSPAVTVIPVRIFLCVSLLVALSQVATAADQPSPPDLTARIEQYMAARVERGDFNGTVLLARNGKIIFCRGFGMANIEHDVPCTPSTKFRLGSITKQFTAMAILILQERGKLAVTDKVKKFISGAPRRGMKSRFIIS